MDKPPPTAILIRQITEFILWVFTSIPDWVWYSTAGLELSYLLSICFAYHYKKNKAHLVKRDKRAGGTCNRHRRVNSGLFRAIR